MISIKQQWFGMWPLAVTNIHIMSVTLMGGVVVAGIVGLTWFRQIKMNYPRLQGFSEKYD